MKINGQYMCLKFQRMGFSIFLADLIPIQKGYDYQHGEDWKQITNLGSKPTKTYKVLTKRPNSWKSKNIATGCSPY